MGSFSRCFQPKRAEGRTIICHFADTLFWCYQKCVPLKLLLHKKSLKYHTEAWQDPSLLSRLLFLMWKAHMENGGVTEVFLLHRACECLDAFVLHGKWTITGLGI